MQSVKCSAHVLWLCAICVYPIYIIVSNNVCKDLFCVLTSCMIAAIYVFFHDFSFSFPAPTQYSLLILPK